MAAVSILLTVLDVFVLTVTPGTTSALDVATLLQSRGALKPLSLLPSQILLVRTNGLL
jgi:hypothetical protein